MTFYGESLMESLILDRFKYRGKGRPRKIDYIPIPKAQKILNKFYNKVLMDHIYGKV